MRGKCILVGWCISSRSTCILCVNVYVYFPIEPLSIWRNCNAGGLIDAHCRTPTRFSRANAAGCISQRATVREVTIEFPSRLILPFRLPMIRTAADRSRAFTCNNNDGVMRHPSLSFVAVEDFQLLFKSTTLIFFHLREIASNDVFLPSYFEFTVVLSYCCYYCCYIFCVSD